MDNPSRVDDPGDGEAFRAAMRLALISGVGPRIRRALVDRFGSAQDVLAAAPSELREVKGVGATLLRRILAAETDIDVDAELARCRQHDVRVLLENSDAYPRVLREIHDPPGVLFLRGDLKPADALAIGIVGTRHGTQYGLRQASKLAASLARAGFTIVSGLARGIDAAAHRAALEAGGRTLAVLAGGVLNVYPPEHASLAADVARQGAVLSEAPPMFQPLAGGFPQRNRIISGLSLGVIVIEAADRSGALITARHAMEQGREVFAVPGNVDSRTSRGCHRLLRDGATLVETADDVIEQLGPLVEAAPRDDGPPIHHPAELQLNELEKQVLAAVGSEPTAIDTVVSEAKLPVPRVLSILSVLEMRRLIRRLSGSMVVRT